MNIGFKTACAAVWIACFGYGPAFAAQDFSPLGNEDVDALYQRVLQQPANIELGLQYARVAVARGDYEAAITVYERLLLYNPALSQLRFDLGVLYFQLESYAAARPYFEAVIAAGGELQDRARAYLADIDRLLSPDRWTAFLHFGVRHQSNATAGPAAFTRIGGQSIPVTNTFAKQPDWNAFIQAAANYEHDFGNARGDTFEATWVGYYAKQFVVTQVDLGAGEVQAGPRFAFFPEYLSGVSTKIYGILNGYTLGDHPYLWTHGAGFSVRKKVNPLLVLETAFEYRDRKFYNSVNYPVAALQSGDLFTYAVAGGGVVSGPVRWFGRAGYDLSRADFAFWSYERPFFDLGLPITFAVDWFGSSRAWVVTPYAGMSWINYDAANPLVDPNVVRRDREWHVGTTLDAEFLANAGVRINVFYQRYTSNISNFDFRNLAVSVGPAFRF